MSEKSMEIRVPDIGDFSDIPVIEVLVAVGDSVSENDPLVTLESDKATMEVPAPASGTIESLKVSEGDTLSEGDLIGSMIVSADSNDSSKQPDATEEKPSSTSAKPASTATSSAAPDEADCDVVVLGAGPGGYTAAFRAADLGLKTVLIERYSSLGGVCLNVGCIPSKALLHTAKVIEEAAEMEKHGVVFGKPKIDLDGVRGFKESVVDKLTGGLVGLAKQRKVQVITGKGEFTSPHNMSIDGPDGVQSLSFKHAIIAAGSQPVEIPVFPNDDPRLIDSTGALALESIPKSMLVIGGGVIGLEMANVYSVLGAKVDVVELLPNLIPGADLDLVKVLNKRMKERLRNIWLKTRVTEIKAGKKGLKVSFEGDKAPEPTTYEKVLVSVGRKPNGGVIGAEKAGVEVDERGFINVDKQMRTNVHHIFAIGDIVGQPMLAHKATHEGKIAAENIAGEKAFFDARCIPSVVYTEPEVGWVGLTELEAKEQGIKLEKGVFPWAANGRSLGMANSEGFTKVLFDPETERVLGGAAVGPNAGELIAEIGLAIEMGADMHDIGMTIHAHPTLSESVCMASEAAAGTLTDLYIPKRK